MAPGKGRFKQTIINDSYMEQPPFTVNSGDYGDTTYLVAEIDKRFPSFADRHIEGRFSWIIVVKGNAPALGFNQACDDVVRFWRKNNKKQMIQSKSTRR